MIIHDKLIQGSPEWLAFRAGKITGTDVAEFCLEPIAVNLTAPQIDEILIGLGIDFKKSAAKPIKLALLPDIEQYMEISKAARDLLIQKICDVKPQDPWQILQLEKEARQFSYMPQIERGNKLEPQARVLYELIMGLTITEVGFVSDDSEQYGMSPDGLILNDAGRVIKGVEIKSAWPKNHDKWLLDHYGKGTVPPEHFYQCQMGMVSCECDEWDFLAYCPNEAPLLTTLHRCKITDQLEVGLKEMLRQKAIIQAQLADMWDREYENKPHLLTFHNGNPMFDASGNPLDDQGNLLAAEGQSV